MSAIEKREHYQYLSNQPLGYGKINLTVNGPIIRLEDTKPKVVETYCDPKCPPARKPDPSGWMGVL